MALIHEFLLASKDISNLEITRNANGKINKKKSKIIDMVEVHDDIIQYIFDSLRWIPNSGGSSRDSEYGLYYHGYTNIESNGAAIMRRVFSAWADLFSNAPDQFTIKGTYSIDEDKFIRITVDRENVVKVLRKVSNFAELVEKDNNLYIMHCGI